MVAAATMLELATVVEYHSTRIVKLKKVVAVDKIREMPPMNYLIGVGVQFAGTKPALVTLLLD